MHWLHKQFRFYRFFPGDFVGIPLDHRKHECNEERPGATSFDGYISLRIPWANNPQELFEFVVSALETK